MDRPPPRELIRRRDSWRMDPWRELGITPMAQRIAEGLELRLHPWPPAGLDPIDAATVLAPLAGEPPAPDQAMTARLTDAMVAAVDALERAVQSDDGTGALAGVLAAPPILAVLEDERTLAWWRLNPQRR